MSHTPDLTPGLMIIHGNRLESLRELVVDWLRAHPLGPLENEVMLVQSNGIAQWLQMALAADPEQGGCGVAAALDVQLPARFLWDAYRNVLGREAVPETSPLDKEPLTWRLMRLLPGRRTDRLQCRCCPRSRSRASRRWATLPKCPRQVQTEKI